MAQVPRREPARSAHRYVSFEEWLENRPVAGVAPIGASEHGDGTQSAADPVEASAQVLSELWRHREVLCAELAATDELIVRVSAIVDRTARRLRVAEAPELMTITRAARYLGVARNTLYKMIDDGELATSAAQGNSNRVWLRKSELDAYIQERPARGRVKGSSGRGTET